MRAQPLRCCGPQFPICQGTGSQTFACDRPALEVRLDLPTSLPEVPTHTLSPPCSGRLCRYATMPKSLVRPGLSKADKEESRAESKRQYTLRQREVKLLLFQLLIAPWAMWATWLQGLDPRRPRRRRTHGCNVGWLLSAAVKLSSVSPALRRQLKLLRQPLHHVPQQPSCQHLYLQ
jgi:hypothetical protein